MTVIVGAVTKQGISIAADGETSYGWEKRYGEKSKLWVDQGYAFGACGCARTSQVLRHHVTWPKYRADEEPNLETFLVTILVPAMWKGLRGHGVVESENGYASMGSSFLIAVGDRLANISGNGYVHIEESGRMAIGSGYAEALGALGEVPPWTEANVVEAARRAALTAHGVGGRLSVVNTKTLVVRDA